MSRQVLHGARRYRYHREDTKKRDAGDFEDSYHSHSFQNFYVLWLSNLPPDDLNHCRSPLADLGGLLKRIA